MEKDSWENHGIVTINEILKLRGRYEHIHSHFSKFELIIEWTYSQYSQIEIKFQQGVRL